MLDYYGGGLCVWMVAFVAAAIIWIFRKRQPASRSSPKKKCVRQVAILARRTFFVVVFHLAKSSWRFCGLRRAVLIKTTHDKRVSTHKAGWLLAYIEVRSNRLVCYVFLAANLILLHVCICTTPVYTCWDAFIFAAVMRIAFTTFHPFSRRLCELCRILSGIEMGLPRIGLRPLTFNWHCRAN